MNDGLLRNIIHALTNERQRAAAARFLFGIRDGIRDVLVSKQPDSPARKLKSLADFAAPYRLHLGCGNIGINGFCNVDVLETVGVDIVDDIRSLTKFPDDCAEEIYACHVLEHFGHDEILPILKRWYEVLKPGGVLRISVPDIDRIVKIYAKNMPHFETPGHSPWIGLIYGGQSTPYDFHKTGFNACWLRYLLQNCGFAACEEYPHSPHFCPDVVDASLAYEPFGEYFSLNMLARKPSVSR